MTPTEELASLRAQLAAYISEKIAINNALNETDSRGCSGVEQIESLQAQLAALRAENKKLRELLRYGARLEALAGHWIMLAECCEGLATKPMPGAPASYVPSLRGSKMAYEECAKALRSALSSPSIHRPPTKEKK